MLSVTELTVPGGEVMQLNTYRFIWVVTLNGMFQQDVPFEFTPPLKGLEKQG
jgi:hypothetical protein